MVKVLDKGYVKTVDLMGSDLSVVNAARTSFAKEVFTMGEKDEKLIHYLARHGHMSPFRHAFVTLEIKAPLMVMRQWWKYVVGSDHTMDGWNEVSRRYVMLEPEFYVPNQWRKAPENKKQGSCGLIDGDLKAQTDYDWQCLQKVAEMYYDRALRRGVAPEQARLFLPAYAMYTVSRWSASLQSVIHFLSQRLEDDAQWEIQQYAKAVDELVRPLFPVSFDALLGGESNEPRAG